MFQSVFNSLFGCSHQRTTFPLTPARKSGVATPSNTPRKGAYIVCLDCGKEFAYDWDVMRVGQPVPAHALPRPTATSVERMA
jgi:hypothetical protein